jgi:4'-phosphopantetheinyl transferase
MSDCPRTPGSRTNPSFSGRFAPSRGPGGLDPGTVHVWYASLDDLPEAVLREPLSHDERERVRRFHFERDRRRFVTARGLLRFLLGHYVGRDPADLRFGYGPRGKPFLAGNDGPRFSLSHSGGLVVLAFARDRELGVDIEQERPLPEAEDLARCYFSPWERAELRRLSPRERQPAFFRCWTRKEAFIKATGNGLSCPLDAFDVTLAPRDPARLLRIEGEPEAARRFWLEDLQPAADVAGALAVEGRPRRVVSREWETTIAS